MRVRERERACVRESERGKVLVRDCAERENELGEIMRAWHLLARVEIDVLDPAREVIVGRLLCHVVHKDDAVRAAVVGRGESAEALLPGCVPDL